MKTTVAALTTLCALWTTALSGTNRGFDGTWVGEEYIHPLRGKWPQADRPGPLFHPTFIIANNGTLVGRLNGPAAGRFDHVVLKGGTLYFGAGNTSFELSLSSDGQTLIEMARVASWSGMGACTLTGQYHRQ